MQLLHVHCAGVKSELFDLIYWFHILVIKFQCTHIVRWRWKEVGRMEGEAQSGEEEVGILHFAYKEVSVGRSNAAARGKKKGEGNGGTHHHPSGGASSTV